MTGGIYDNSPDNITPLISVELHAALHKDLWRHLGKWQDFIAWKMLLGLSLKGIEYTPELRKKMSDSHKGKPSSMKGKHHSEESKIKMSIARKGKKITKPRSNEWKLNQSKVQRGRKLSEETKQKMKLSHIGKDNHQLGRKHSEKSKIKMSNSHSKINYQIIFPSGKKEIIKNLKQFCRENNLIDSNMYAVLKGKRKQHKGFKCEKVMKNYD